MIIRPNIINFLSIGIMSFAGVWLINRALRAGGMGGLCSMPMADHEAEEM
jgi:hypothetical protein